MVKSPAKVPGRHNPDRTDPANNQLADFGPLVTAMRWGTITIGILLAATESARGRLVAEGALLLAYALWRTVRPLTYQPRHLRDLIAILAELVLVLAIIDASEYWGSPYIFSLVPVIVAAGFARGFGFALEVAFAAIATIAIPYHLLDETATVRTTTEWGSELLLVALIAGYGRRLFYEAEQRTSAALGRLQRLSEANELLYQLNRVAQTLPASLDLGEAIDSTMTRIRELFRPDATAILLWDDTAETWVAGAAEGTRIPEKFNTEDLPPPMRLAATSGAAQLIPNLGTDGPGFSSSSNSGIYAPLRARGRLNGLLAIEKRAHDSLTVRDLGLTEGLAEQAALALDNARWFDRLRTVGADQERTRIARDLHDRVGQSLAYLAFELDRLMPRAETTELQEPLETLRQDVRKVVVEVRETLYDLRTDVSDTDDLIVTLTRFLERVEGRSDIRTVFRHTASRRLPLPQEREMWRIAQEAVTNAERHAAPSAISVTWSCSDDGARIEIADDGRGFSPRTARRLDSYGILGMRERADAIGATLEIDSAPGKGTTIRCTLGAP